MNPVILALAFGNFMIGAGALSVAGMLPALATGLKVSIPVAAQLITAFALAVCLSAPFLAALTARFDRRALLICMMLIFAAGHAASALVSDMHSQLVLRVICALASALYTPQAAATVAQLVPPEKRASAIAAVFMGWAISTVFGMPVGAYVGETLGWRVGFALIAAGSLLSALCLWVVPKGLKTQVAGLAMWKQLLVYPALLMAIAVTAVQSTGQFVAFGFLVPAFKSMAQATPLQVSILLGLYGVFGVIGSYLAGRAADKYGPPKVVLVACFFAFLGMASWPLGSMGFAVFVVVQILWGLGGFSINSTQQGRLANMAPALAPVSIALNTSSIYLGQALGTPLGTSILQNMGPETGYAWLGPVGAPFLLLAMLVSWWANRMHQRKLLT